MGSWINMDTKALKTSRVNKRMIGCLEVYVVFTATENEIRLIITFMRGFLFYELR